MTIENSNLEQKGAVFILFLGIMVAIMSAASLLQQHYATNDDQIYNSVIKKQVIATAESAINIKRNNLYELIISNATLPTATTDPSDSDLNECLGRLNLNVNNLVSGTNINMESNTSFDTTPATYFTSAILSVGDDYQIVACGYNRNTLVSSDIVTSLVQTVTQNPPAPAVATSLESLNWIER